MNTILSMIEKIEDKSVKNTLLNEYYNLKEEATFLSYLEMEGVDNWAGYPTAWERMNNEQ